MLIFPKSTEDRIELQYQQEASENATDDGMPEAPQKIQDEEDAETPSLWDRIFH